MAYNNFKQTFWSKYIQTELKKAAVLVANCNQEFEGEVKYGNKVKILGVGKPTIVDYTGSDIDIEKVPDNSVMLEITQSKAFAFEVDDVDKAQSKEGLMEALMGESKEALSNQRELFVGSMALQAGKASTSTAITTADAAKKAIDAGMQWLYENDVAINDIIIELPAFMWQLMRDKYIELDTDNSNMLGNGQFGRYNGAKVYMSNQLYSTGTGDTKEYHAMIRTKRAIAFASQINKVEAFRPEKRFSDAVKGLDVYGAKVVRPKELYDLICKKK